MQHHHAAGSTLALEVQRAGRLRWAPIHPTGRDAWPRWLRKVGGLTRLSRGLACGWRPFSVCSGPSLRVKQLPRRVHPPGQKRLDVSVLAVGGDAAV
jgi:hypothetical protein